MHSAVWATGGMSSCKPGFARALVSAVGMNFVLLSASLLAAPPADDPLDFARPDRGAQRSTPNMDAQSAADQLNDLLRSAREAMAAGKVDQPENDCAWYYFRQIADKYPENEDAKQGLAAVRQDMLHRVIGYAEEMDFDSAERLLEDAAEVLEDQALIVQTRTAVERIKSERAGVLELHAIELMDAGDFDGAERMLIDLVGLGGRSESVKQLRQRLEEAKFYGGFKPGQLIRDHLLGEDIFSPESVVIPAGSFLMGSIAKEQGRVENEGPQHRVTFRHGFALGRNEVTVAEFRAFVDATGFKTTAEHSRHSTVYDPTSGRLLEKEGVYWEMDYEGKPARGGDPVLHVSFKDAQAYVNWLASGTGKSYRLPSEAEFEYALRAGSNTRFWWGNASPFSVVENITGELDSSGSRRVWKIAFSGYADKFWGPAPAASFQPNPFGLFDMGGNVSEWVSDCWHDTYVRAPPDGAAWINPGCDQRVIRGGYWASLPDQTRSAYRRFAPDDYHDARIGFRIARDL